MVLVEISLSFLCLHSSCVSVLDLAPPLHVGHTLASFLHPDQRGLKERLTGWGWGSGSLRSGEGGL